MASSEEGRCSKDSKTGLRLPILSCRLINLERASSEEGRCSKDSKTGLRLPILSCRLINLESAKSKNIWRAKLAADAAAVQDRHRGSKESTLAGYRKLNVVI
jgi:hypothetical protein